ncbi:MAG TPA: AraC family transcriptional regulator [Polyangiaceae bacterium]|jgi:AraC-like DNA-binding protein|nr:AraC family transcriptional regulator [Polyangiaceae bacterium]
MLEHAPVTPASNEDTRLSIRLLWPFFRAAGVVPAVVDELSAAGIGSAEFANPSTRVSHRLMMHLLDRCVAASGDPALGLRAGEQLEPANGDVLAHASPFVATLGDAMRCISQYLRLVSDAEEVTLAGAGEFVEWRFRSTDGVPRPAAVNDFIIASMMKLARLRLAKYEPPTELRFMHERPSYASAYDRFETRVVFGAPYNAIVMPKSRLAMPMQRKTVAGEAFELHARQVLQRMNRKDGLSGRVREEVALHLSTGVVSMNWIAEHLAMSVATLRRRLGDEGTTYAEVVDDIRKQLADRYLKERALTVSEIAFLLGFANVTAFHRAFKRWRGMPPAAYRAKQWGSTTPA